MSNNTALSAAARTRIGGFTASLGTIIVSLIVIGVLVALTNNGGMISNNDDAYRYRPWTNPDPQEATRDGDTFTGAGQAFIDLADLEVGVPLQLDFEAYGPIRDLDITGPGAAAINGNESIPISTYDNPNYLLPASSALQLWVTGREHQPWSISITPADLTERAGTASGVGPLAFLYTGAATTARVSTSGNSTVTIDVITEAGEAPLYSSREQKGLSVAWHDSAAVIFLVRASSDAAWTIEFHEQVTATPSPTPSNDE